MEQDNRNRDPKREDSSNLDEEMERDTKIRRDTQVRGSLGLPPSGEESDRSPDRDEGVPELESTESNELKSER